MICIWYFSICLSLLVSLEWLANQTHHTAPVNFRVFVPAYVYYEMLLYILMEYCTLVTSQPGGAWIAPFTSARQSACTFWNLNLFYVFFFCSLISLHIFIASASQNFKTIKKNNMKIFTLQLCCTKKPIRYALNATNKNLLFSFLLGFPPCYF